MPSCACFGFCGGVPGVRDPITGLVCNVCSGTGTYSYETKKEHDEREWETFWKPLLAKNRTFAGPARR